jgi:hypothetical protein
MGTRLASMMVSLHHDQPLRLLVPYRTKLGKLAFRVETHRRTQPGKARQPPHAPHRPAGCLRPAD